MRKLLVIFIMGLSVFSVQVKADALGLFVGGGIWDHDASGTFGTLGDDVIDVESDLNYSGDTDSYVWAAFEHFVPLIPNVRVEAASLSHDGTGTGIVFNGVTVSGSSAISLDTTDAILYYRLLDNWVNFDVGLNIRKLDGQFRIATETVSVTETIPMLYAAAQFDLPFTGFSVGGDINIISFDGSTYQDVRLRALFETGVIGFEAGLRTTVFELDDVDNINADLDFSGLMLGAFLHF